MAQASRPLSPHLDIYRWYFTMALSIAHRVTGGALAWRRGRWPGVERVFRDMGIDGG